MTRVAIIVLNWNGADDAIKCTESLLAQTLPADIILVDNASRQDSINELQAFVIKTNDSRLTFLRNNTNSGYSGGNNVGFRHALDLGYEYIGTLNPDAKADDRWAERLLDVLDSHSDVGIATGLMLDATGDTIDTSGEYYTTWGVPGPRMRGAPRRAAPSAEEYVFGSTGGGFITRASLLQDIGMLDEKFFMYYEDVDFCFRAQLAGYKVYYTPRAIAYHKISASTNRVPGLAVKQTFQNLPMLFVKNVPLSLWPHIWPRFALTYLLIFGNAVVHGRGVPAFVGWWRHIGLVRHMFRERRRIQTSRKVSDRYIDSIILHDIPPEQTGLRKFRKFFTGR